MPQSLKDFFFGKKVLITGHTGFKGSWLSLLLQHFGASVVGYSLQAPTDPNLFTLADVKSGMISLEGDIRDLSFLKSIIHTHQPEVIFHLAAQSLVIHGFEKPLETFTANAIGTANVLEASRNAPFIKAIVIVTTDKCYHNKEWEWGYRENDALGGLDPYSASKAMAEMVAASYRHSFFKGQAAIATVRAGNVIGGGDFSFFRLVPDAMRALIHKSSIHIRNLHSTRPWIHVLDPLYGYLMLAQNLVEQGELYAEGWNFGPKEHRAVSNITLIQKIIELWGEGSWQEANSSKTAPEMRQLQLNWDKAANRLGWNPIYDWHQALEETVSWFKNFEQFQLEAKNVNLQTVCFDQIKKFLEEHEIYSNAT